MPETDSLKALQAEIKKNKELLAQLQKTAANVKELKARAGKTADELKKSGKELADAEE